MNSIQLRQSIREMLNEDIGSGDITTESLVEASHQSSAVLLAKQSGVIAGLPIITLVFQELDPHLEFQPQVAEGQKVEAYQTIAVLSGSTKAILTA